MEQVIIAVHGLILDHVPPGTKRTPSGWMTLDCVMCNDRRHRGGIKTDGARISYNCFNCGFKTGWAPSPHLSKKFKKLVQRLGAAQTQIQQAQVLLLKHSNELANADQNNYGFQYDIQKFSPVEFPRGTVNLRDLPENHELVEYARSRKLLGLYDLYHIPTLENRRRVIVPFLYEKQLVGWSGRHINPANKNTAKYLTQHSPRGYVFNMDSFVYSQRDIVVVTEGLFDAIQLDGVSIHGNDLGAEQANIIEKLANRVILCPDRDKAGKKLIEQATDRGWEVSFPTWKYKDAADAAQHHGRLATLAHVIQNSTSNITKAKVKAKMIKGNL